MDPETDTGDLTFGRYLEYAGPWGTFALVAGLVVLVLAIRAARRRATQGHAIALFAVAWLPFAPVLLFGSFYSTHPLIALTLRWSDPEAQRLHRLLAFDPNANATNVACAIGLLVGLAGAVAALARSRPRTASQTV